MAVYGESWLSEVGTQLRSVVDAFWGEVKQHGMLTLLEPVPPFNKPSFLSPPWRSAGCSPCCSSPAWP
jgi:hypothetical protein